MFVSYGRHLQGINCLLISTCNTRLKRGYQHKTIWEWGYLIYLLDVWKKKLWMMLQFLKSDFIVMLILYNEISRESRKHNSKKNSNMQALKTFFYFSRILMPPKQCISCICLHVTKNSVSWWEGEQAVDQSSHFVATHLLVALKIFFIL